MYRYILIDKIKKEVTMVASDKCMAVTQSNLEEKYKISHWEFHERFRLEWNGEDSDWARLPKKYSKYTKIVEEGSK